MAVAIPFPTTVDLQTADAFQVDCVVDHEAGDNTGLIPARAALLIDLHEKRRAREQVQNEHQAHRDQAGEAAA